MNKLKKEMKIDRKTYTDFIGNHAYEVETISTQFEVHARDRRHAYQRVTKDGYEVRSINMIG